MRDLSWMKEIVAGSEHALAIFGPDPFALTVRGKRMAIVTNWQLIVAVPTDQELAEPWSTAPRGEGVERYLTMPDHADPYEANLARLKAWAGAPVRHEIYFNRDGEGPIDVPTHRSCILYGIALDANLLAHALQAFEGETVQIAVGGERDAVRITDGKSFASIMPWVMPRWTPERGPIGSCAEEPDEARA